MTEDRSYFVVPDRCASLGEAGRQDYYVASALDHDGNEHLVLVESRSVGDPAVRYDATCLDVDHEQVGPLPLEFVRRLAVAARVHRCGRLTQAGRPCRIRVAVVGAACEWHRSRADA
jgi:hypothetical protein